MVRSAQLIHPAREAAPLRPAATVLLLRDTPHGPEVLMTRRSMTASFAPGAYVFPGGGIDKADALAHPIAKRRATQHDSLLTEAIAAIRESFEELGVLLAYDQHGQLVRSADFADLSRHASLTEQCQSRGWALAADQVFCLAHWITDRDLPRRFDVPFLIARMPDDQEPVADEQEQFEPTWVSPAQALERHATGDFFMIFPTIRTLERLKAFNSVDAILDACCPANGDEKPLWTSCPRAGLLGGAEARYMESDMPFGELELVCPDGQIVHELGWQSTAPVRLLKNVQRLTAPNPSAMTGPGTNSYVVGDVHTGHIVIDPGPYGGERDMPHIQRLFDAAGGDIRAIICTHSHQDHSPGAKPLQDLCAKVGKQVPVLGLPSASTARKGCEFTPDKTLQNRELITLTGYAEKGILVHTLEVIYTPGHAANHLCLMLQEDGLLFSGDHILNGSTTVIDPPDGDMNLYLDSLDQLSAACHAHHLDFILPAHGWVLHRPLTVISHLKAHRLAREAKVAAAMKAKPDGSLQDWVALAYADTPPKLWPVALRSLTAHVERLRALVKLN
ncbi:MAG: MBL fold metallo-hydrolase [Hylemonella sp.]|nr:MBL fold metallo-hydrolase [Hylemonella sp.]